MTQAEFANIMYALDNVEEREKRICASYCAINPNDKARREDDMDLYLLAICAARNAIQKAATIE